MAKFAAARKHVRQPKAIEADIKGSKLKFYAPDGYKDSAVNIDPPQQRLKLEWVYVLETSILSYFNIIIACHHPAHEKQAAHLLDTMYIRLPRWCLQLQRLDALDLPLQCHFPSIVESIIDYC